jgi:FMN phosphatase YigB (HAD superfamily)
MSGPSVYVFDAYGTLFDVHAAIARHRAAAGQMPQEYPHQPPVHTVSALSALRSLVL